MDTPITTISISSDRYDDLTQDFTGREWAFKALDEWLEPGKGPRYLITGGPGSGKSALSARLVQVSRGETPENGYRRLKPGFIAYAHFCQVNDPDLLSPARFIENLSGALAGRYPQFNEALLQITRREGRVTVNAAPVQEIGTVESGATVIGTQVVVKLGGLALRPAFDLAVRQPLQIAFRSGPDEPVVILVDALDEALTYDGDINLVELLKDAVNLPPQVRFLYTGRPDDQVLESLGPRDLDLVDDAPADQEDVHRYARNRLRGLEAGRRGDFAYRLAQKSAGNFLYARYVLDDLLQMLDAIEELEDFPLPADLEEHYRQYLKRELAKNLQDWRKMYAPVLGLVAVAQGEGLTATLLQDVTGQYRSEIDAVLAVSDQYLIGRPPEGPFRIYHQSFRDFLMKDSLYRVYPEEANARMSDGLLRICNKRWAGCPEAYAYRYMPHHLAEAARLNRPPRRHSHAENLVDVVLAAGVSEPRPDAVDYAANLRLALETAARDDDPQGPALVLRAALAWEAFRTGWLQPGELFTLAKAGDLEAAEARLNLFAPEAKWRTAILLALAWQAAREHPDAAAALRKRLEGALEGWPELKLLDRRLEAALEEVDLPAGGLPDLPGPPPPDLVELILQRLGAEFQPSMINPELIMEMKLEGHPQTTEVLWGRSGAEGIYESVLWGRYQELLDAASAEQLTGSAGPAYIGEMEGPLLVAHALANPGEGTQNLCDYIRLHAANNYVYYRNQSLWGVLRAVLSHPDPGWTLEMLADLTEAALSPTVLEFREGLPIALLSFDDPDLENAFDRVVKRGKQSLHTLLQEGRSDSWGIHARRLAALAEALSIRRKDLHEAALLMDAALNLPRGYAGFRAPCMLSLADSMRVARTDPASIRRALQEAMSAAQNIQDPVFCVRMTARVNAMQSRFWPLPDGALDFAAELDAFLKNPETTASGLHTVGEGFTQRQVSGDFKLDLPHLFYHAETLIDLARVYQQPLIELMRLNPSVDPEESLKPGAQVRIPDPEFIPLVAARLSAEALAAEGLTPEARVQALRELAPHAADNLTCLDAVLARLLLAAGPLAEAEMEALRETLSSKLKMLEPEPGNQVSASTTVPDPENQAAIGVFISQVVRVTKGELTGGSFEVSTEVDQEVQQEFQEVRGELKGAEIDLFSEAGQGDLEADQADSEKGESQNDDVSR